MEEWESFWKINFVIVHKSLRHLQTGKFLYFDFVLCEIWLLWIEWNFWIDKLPRVASSIPFLSKSRLKISPWFFLEKVSVVSVSSLLKQPMRFHKNTRVSRIRQDKLDSMRLFKDSRQTSDLCVVQWLSQPLLLYFDLQRSRC